MGSFFNSTWPGPEHKKRWVRKRVPKDECVFLIERKYIFIEFLCMMPINASHPDKGLDSFCHETGRQLSVGQSASLWGFPFDFGYLFSQVPCSLIGKMKVLGDRTVWCNANHNKIQ